MFQFPRHAYGCHYSMIYIGNQTLAYPYGWRNDRWLQNVVELPVGEIGIGQAPLPCQPGKSCSAKKRSTKKPDLVVTSGEMSRNLRPGIYGYSPPPKPYLTSEVRCYDVYCIYKRRII